MESEWTRVWQWIKGRLGKRCQSYLDTMPPLACELRHGHLTRHRMGNTTWEVGMRDGE